MPKRGYDLKRIEQCMSAIKTSPKTMSNYTKLRSELNDFFPEAKCNNIFYTDNKDKLFFGMMVLPSLTDEQVTAIALDDGSNKELYKVKEYSIDIDSKIIETIDLNARELTAVLLHEVGHLVIDDSPTKIIQRNMDEFFRKERTNVDINKLAQCPDILKFGIEDAMVKCVSLWYKDEEVVADSFVVSCGYGDALQTVLRKTSSSIYFMSSGANVPKFIMLHWSLRLYTDINAKRIPAIKTLEKAISISGSNLLGNKMDYLRKRLINFVPPISSVKGSIANPILDSSIRETTNLIESLLRENKVFNSLKMSGLRSIESDSYEYEMRIRNVEDEMEALQLLREINSRLSMVENYMGSPKLSQGDLDRCKNMYSKFIRLREELSKKKIYKRKNYGLWYDYNDLTPDQVAQY